MGSRTPLQRGHGCRNSHGKMEFPEHCPQNLGVVPVQHLHATLVQSGLSMTATSDSSERRPSVIAKNEDQATILEVYRIFVATITAAENRRHQASTVYLGMIVALATVIGAFQEIRLWSILGVMPISVVWLFNVYSFRQLAKAKFHVIKILEAKLPFAAFDAEEEERKKRQRIDLTHLEMAVPVLVILFCLVMLCLNRQP